MWNRRPRVVPLSAAVAGIVLLLIGGGPGSSTRPAGSWSPGRVAHAQNPGAQVRYSVVTERSEVRYRVREQLAGLSFPNDAVGATNAIEGGISLDPQGRVLAGESRFTVDLRLLRSDEGRRDRYIQRNTLETDRYPTVVFIPVEVRRLSLPLPQTGTMPFELVGDLTVRETTRRVIWEGTATFDGQALSVRARTAFRFEDFGLRVPRVSVVLSVEDHIRLETDLVLRRSS